MKGTFTKTCIKYQLSEATGKYQTIALPQLAPAILLDGLAIHSEAIGGLPCYWVVSHCASGLEVARFYDRQRALEGLKALAPLYDWDALTPDNLPADIRLQVDLAIGHLLDAEDLEAELEDMETAA